MSDKIVSYEQFEQISNKIKQYVDDSVIFTQELLNDNINAYVATTREEINILLANNYSSLETFLEYSDALSTSFQLLQYGVNLKLESLNDNIEGVYNELLDLKEDLNANFTLDPVSMKIQQKDSKYGFMVAEKEINFIEGKEKIGIVANDEWSMNNVKVEETFSLGPFKFTNKRNGHLTFTWEDRGNIVMFADSYPNKSGTDKYLHTINLYNELQAGSIYTIEMCSNVPDTYDNEWMGLDLRNGNEYIVGLFPEYYHNGTAIKSFKAKKNTDKIGLEISKNTSEQNFISYVKIYEGDEIWRDTHNYLSYNNVWTEARKYNYTSGEGTEIMPTALYGYLDKDTVYNFKCNVDAEFGNAIGEDTVYMCLIHDDYDESNFKAGEEIEENENIIEIPSTDHIFTVNKTGRWKLRFFVLQHGTMHSFWDAKIEKLGMVYEVFEDSEIKEGDEIIEEEEEEFDEEIIEGGDE